MLCNTKPVPFHESDKHIFAKIPGGGGGPDPRSPSLDPPMVKIRVRGCVQFNNNSRNAAIYVLVK